MLLTVACMPSLLHQRDDRGDLRVVQMGELAVVDRDVASRGPAESVARRAPGISRSMRASTCLHAREVARARGGVLLVALVEPPVGERTSATAPFSATIASTGQTRAKGSLQPTGRPVIATRCRPAAFRSCQRLQAHRA